MLSNLRSPDTQFFASHFAQANERAKAFEASGDVLAAAQENSKIVQDFKGNADIEQVEQQATMLRASKAYKEELKREQREFDEQRSIVNDLMSGLSAVKNGASTEASTPLRAQLSGLADAARKTPRTPEIRVRLRALNSVVVYMWETESED